MIRGDRLRDVLEKDSLTGAGRRNNQGALTLADRGDDVDDASRIILPRRIFDFEFQPLVRIERRQIVEMDLVADLLGILEIDRIDLEEREIPLAFLRPPDRPVDGVARAKAEAADLAWRDVNVVGTGQIIRIGRAQEAEAVLQHLDDAGADDLHLPRRELFENREHELLLAHGARVLDLKFLGECDELGRASWISGLEA